MTTLPSSRRHFLLSSAGLTCLADLHRSFAAPVRTEPETATSSAALPALAPPDKQPQNLQIPQKPTKQLGWAIVGLGELALGEVLPAFGECELSKPVALVSGHPDKARRVADFYGIERNAIYNYDNYDRLADDPRVDVIYIILPNSMHAEYTIRGLKAGKHVLCEKPMATSPDEARQMIAASKEAQRHLMIAYRLHYEPFNQRAMEICKSGALGKIRTFASTNGQNVKAPNIRLSARLGGGPLGDVGVYSINAARYTLGEEPVEVFAVAQQPKDDPRFREVPESVAFTLRYPSGALAHCDCGFGMTESRFYEVHGTEGTLRMQPAFSYRGLRLHVRDSEAKGGTDESRELLLEPKNHFSQEMDHFSQVVMNNETCRTPGEMGLADMVIIEALERSLKTNAPVRLDG
ncbi:MAG: Gfo/Idh/MocA family oxidoreductase [Prosthecobacter sp.]|jgi:predicted dehydrogenase|uniref:Gfo/Idh/MocA family protein n=1 Tax=Prosthecobacter sp. TaxID=1965333 RepID=UPI0019F3431C|nr:Gfo/Idh/MocA family oxidoreductase [Prosthecobacter sp.]MBE2281952.1 Gfo/Idh/MocA family oxidoreductase [Prosthecobacter sp.]